MQIGHFSFDPEKGRLQADDGREVKLRSQSMKVLGLLAEAGGAVVVKEQFLSQIWPDVTVGEDSLYQCIAEIRRAIGDDRHELLRTVPGKGYVLSARTSTVPSVAGPPSLEPIRFVRSGDVCLAWTAIGQGVPILKAPSWISNIETEANSLIFGPFYSRLGQRARIVHFDQRGSSLSSRRVSNWSVDAMVNDMAAVADAAGLDRFFLFGPSQGAAFSIAFAARYPDRVRGIIARGAFASGWLASGDEENKRKYDASKALINSGWNNPDPEYRRFFTGLLMPEAPPEIAREMDDTQARAVDAESQLANLDLQCTLDVRPLLAQITCPVMLLHSAGDLAIKVDRAVEMAAVLPSCELRILEGDNHIPLPGTAGFQQFMDGIEAFLDVHAVEDDA